MLKNKAWREQPLRGDAIEAMKKAAGIARCGLSRKIVCSVVDRPTRSYAKLCSGPCRKMANPRRAAQQ